MSPGSQPSGKDSGSECYGCALDARPSSQLRHQGLKRGPASICCQSEGIPCSSNWLPPPHRKPSSCTRAPHTCFFSLVGSAPNEISTPVAGQLLCVDTESGAVGRPITLRRSCCSRVRYPDVIQTGALVCIWKRLAAWTIRCITPGVTPHFRANSHASRPASISRSGTPTN